MREERGLGQEVGELNSGGQLELTGRTKVGLLRGQLYHQVQGQQEDLD